MKAKMSREFRMKNYEYEKVMKKWRTNGGR